MNLKYYLRGLGIGILVTAIIMLVIAHTSGSSMSDEEIKRKAKAMGMVEESTTLNSLVEKNLQNEDANVDEAIEAAQASEVPEVSEMAEGNAEGDLDSAQSAVSDENQKNENNGDVNSDNSGVANTDTAKTDESKNESKKEEDNAVVSTPSESDLSLDEVEKVLDDADAFLEKKNSKTEKPSNEEPKKEEASPSPSKEPEKSPEASPSPSKAPENATAQDTNSNNDNSNVNNSGNTKKLVISAGEGSFTVSKHLKELGLIENANTFDTYLCDTGKDRKVHTGTYEIPEGTSEEEIARIIAG